MSKTHFVVNLTKTISRRDVMTNRLLSRQTQVAMRKRRVAIVGWVAGLSGRWVPLGQAWSTDLASHGVRVANAGFRLVVGGTQISAKSRGQHNYRRRWKWTVPDERVESS